MRIEGHLKSWNDERGFGFIEPVQGGQEIFAHISDFPAGSGRPFVGLSLSFEVKLGSNGKKRAHGIQFPTRMKKRQPISKGEVPARWTLPRLVVLPAFACLWWYVAQRWGVRPQLVLVYAVLSSVTFIAYVFDKAAARAGRWRTSESTLHTLGFACGWPGALVAQQLLRHKTAKVEFVRGFWITVTLNIATFVAWHAWFLART